MLSGVFCTTKGHAVRSFPAYPLAWSDPPFGLSTINIFKNNSSGSESVEIPEAPVEIPMTSRDLEVVCNGVTALEATAYDKSDATIHPLAVFYRNNANDPLIFSYGRMPDAWGVPFEETAKTELVACLTAVDSKLVKKCDFEIDEKDDVYILEVYDTVYETSIYEAKTGKLLETTRLDVKASDICPGFHMFTDGETTDKLFTIKDT